MSDVRLAIFDLGGTTIRDSANVAAVFATSLSQHGVTVPADDIHRWRGTAKREVIARVAETPSAADALYNTFQHNLIDAFVTQGIEAIPGAEETFATLRGRGLRVMLTTGFDREVVQTILAHLRWHDAVDGVVTADDVRTGRPAPDLILEAMARVGVADSRSVVNVGDTTADLASGSAADVGANLAVLTGAHSRADLESLPHSAILDSVADVPRWMLG